MAYVSTSVVGFLNAPIGLGESARRQIRALRAMRYPVSAHSIDLAHLPQTDFPDIAPGPPPDDSNVIAHINPPELIDGRQFRELVGRRRNYVIGYWHWELPVFPVAWIEALHLVHEVWVPTRFCADAYAGYRRPVRIIPHAVPLNDTPKDLARAALGLPRDRFIFLSTSETGSFPLRKNPEGAARAFVDAFAHTADTAPLLVLKIHGSQNRTSDFERFIAEMQAHPLVHVIDRTLSDEAMRNLQAACDCFVSLHRSEGFGFNIAESMAAGRVAIATNFSGNVDFMTADNSIPIPYEVRALKPHDYLNGQGQYWAEPDHDAVVEAMRWIVDHAEAADAIGRRAKAYIAEHHSFERVGRLVANTLKTAGISYRVPLAQPGRPRSAPYLKLPDVLVPIPPDIQRNALCPCGSGKKYKHCHGR
jgi:glycosyltransferase involved in cell wall biosynthesis